MGDSASPIPPFAVTVNLPASSELEPPGLLTMTE